MTEHVESHPALPGADPILRLLAEGEEALRCGAGRAGLLAVREACRHAREAGEPRLLAWALTRLGQACETTGLLEEAIHATRDAGRLFAACGEPRETAIALYCLGYRELRAGRPEAAEETCQRAVKEARDHGLAEQEAHALVNLGHVYLESGRLGEGEACYARAHEVFASLDNHGGAAATLNSLADVRSQQGRTDEALRLHEDALARSRASGTWTASHDALMRLGEIHFTHGRMEASESCFREALALARLHRQPQREVMAERNLAILRESRGDLDGAARVYHEAHVTLESLGDEAGCAEMLRLFINACKRTSTPERGLEWRRRALKLARAHLGEPVVLELLDNIAEIAFRCRRWPMALDYWENALRLARRVGCRQREVTSLEHLRFMYQQSGRPDLALEPAQDLAEIYREDDDPGCRARTLLHLCEIWLALSEPLMALGVAQKGLALLDDAPEREARIEAGLRGNLANALLLVGEAREAVAEYHRVLALFRELGDLPGQGMAWTNMGTAWRLLGDPEQAGRCGEEAATCIARLAR